MNLNCIGIIKCQIAKMPIGGMAFWQFGGNTGVLVLSIIAWIELTLTNKKPEFPAFLILTCDPDLF